MALLLCLSNVTTFEWSGTLYLTAFDFNIELTSLAIYFYCLAFVFLSITAEGVYYVSSLYFMVKERRRVALPPPQTSPARGPVPLTPSCETFYHAFLRGYDGSVLADAAGVTSQAEHDDFRANLRYTRIKRVDSSPIYSRTRLHKSELLS